MAFGFEKLIVYANAIDFADQVCHRTEQSPRGDSFLVDQPRPREVQCYKCYASPSKDDRST